MSAVDFARHAARQLIYLLDNGYRQFLRSRFESLLIHGFSFGLSIKFINR
jgi:hypothetical protein